MLVATAVPLWKIGVAYGAFGAFCAALLLLQAYLVKEK